MDTGQNVFFGRRVVGYWLAWFALFEGQGAVPDATSPGPASSATSMSSTS